MYRLFRFLPDRTLAGMLMSPDAPFCLCESSLAARCNANNQVVRREQLGNNAHIMRSVEESKRHAIMFLCTFSQLYTRLHDVCLCNPVLPQLTCTNARQSILKDP